MFVQLRLTSGARRRLACLVGTVTAIGALLATGAAATRTRLPTPSAVREAVYATAAPAGGTPLPLDAVDQESTPGYPTVVRKWQLGDPFLRSDVETASAALTRACAAIEAVAPPRQGWRAGTRQAGYCDYVRTVGHVRLHYGASLTPGNVVAGEPQPETVTVLLVGTIASPGNQ